MPTRLPPAWPLTAAASLGLLSLGVVWYGRAEHAASVEQTIAPVRMGPVVVGEDVVPAAATRPHAERRPILRSARIGPGETPVEPAPVARLTTLPTGPTLRATLTASLDTREPVATAPVTPAADAAGLDASRLVHADGAVPPFVTAVPERTHVVLDGRLDDPIWSAAQPVTDLLQREPDEGRPPSERTTVLVSYDADAIYVGARMFDSTPGAIVRRLGRRDAAAHSDDFEVLLDTYHDHRTAFRFAVSAAGVESDELIGDDGEYSDDSWDPVWQAATAIDSLGWTAELRIPFSQLRFSPTTRQVWGIRFERWIERKNERDMFPYVPRTAAGEASHFAHLVGLRDIGSPKRGELLPFTVGRATYHRPSDPADPFDGASRYHGGAGMDLKYGVTPSLTLDGTVNPDFGQVELDPAYVNLTEYEEFLKERRPFFVEGGDIFGFGGSGGGINHFSESPLYFYSRRIGRPPQGSAHADGYVDMPTSSTILGAAKLSGKLGRGWALGVLDALTDREWATIADPTGARSRAEVEPLTNYFTGRLTRDLRGGNTTFGLLGTGVHRDIRTPTLDFLRTSAYAGGVDVLHRWGHNTYTLAGNFGGSYIEGDPAAIQQAQRSSNRYFQRPDARSFRYDPQRRALGGINAELYLNKVAGNWIWGVATRTVAPGFEVNDLGFQKRVDLTSVAAAGGRRWTRPLLMFRKAYAYLTFTPSWNYDGNPIERKYGLLGYAQFRNFWAADISASYSAAVLDDRLTRGGPLAAKPAGASASVEVYTDNRKQMSGYAFASYSRTAAGGWSVSVLPQVTLRHGTALSLSVGPYYDVERSPAQYLQRVSDSTATATGGSRYVFAELYQHTVELTFRVNAAISPALSIQLYAQPFSFSGNYRSFKELLAPRTYAFTTYGRDNGSTIRDTVLGSGGNAGQGYVVDPGGRGRPFTLADPDFRTRSLQFKAVLRWEYRPGSTLYLAWTQSRSGYFPGDSSFSVGRDLGTELFRDRPTNVLLVKVSYWLSW